MPPFQQTILAERVSGIIGEFAYCGPHRCISAMIDSPDAANNVVGRVFTYADEEAGTVRAGGTGAFAGILILPKTHKSLGTPSGGTLARTLTLPNGTQAEFCQMGEVFVQLGSAGGTIGSSLVYHTTTGVINWTDTPGSPPADHALVPTGVLSRRSASAETPSLAIARLTN